ncbi:MAG: RIP metalloprotease RseP [Pseudomonadota bacterium]
MGISIIAFVLVLGVLIFAHELGHFLVARLFGVGVEKFSLGFGPRIAGKTIGRTDYRLSAIPLGGYVKMVGEDPDSDIDPADLPYSFTHKSVFQRICIVAAGPFSNVVLAFLIFYGIFQVVGLHVLEPVIGRVADGTPAAMAGIRPGDRITAINGTRVDQWDEMARLISESGGRTLEIDLLRGDAPVAVTATPARQPSKNIFGEDIDRYMLGIGSAGEIRVVRLNPIEAITHSVSQTYQVTALTVTSIVKLIQGAISTKTIGGPIMIAEMAGQQAKEGAVNLLFFTALISINLAILNVLPIPVLDGGHLMFFFFEAVRGRPVSIRVREIAQQAGMAVLLMLMVFVFYNDITRLLFN